MNVNTDGSESVDQFLARIASVKEGRDEANEERKRRMEEEFLKNRSERQARRLERARSISPSKTGPSRPTSIAAPPAQNRDLAINPPVDFSPRSAALSRSNAVRTSPKLEPEVDEHLPSNSPPSATRTPSPSSSSLSRSGTLSWQQRPSARNGNLGRPRPLSTIETLRPRAKESSPQPASPGEQTKEEITASLASKDASWFRQTQDRGLGSAAFRKNQVEDTPVTDPSVRSMRLPGMSRDDNSAGSTPTPTFSSQSPRNTVVEQSPEDKSSRPAKSTGSQEQSSPKLPQTATISAMSTRSQPRDESNLEAFVNRSPSPTKGLGGFVQSAMLKRSDSVNKRWSVQANTGLKRGDSVAGMRPLNRSNVGSKAMSPPALSPKPDFSQKKSDMTANIDNGLEVSEKAPNELRAVVPTTNVSGSTRPVTPPERGELNRSPSKGLDSKRWSPTKSSWLESTLLAKQEPPKTGPRRDEQPQWMVNLQRSKSMKDLSPERSTAVPQQAQAQSGSSTNDTVESLPKKDINTTKPTEPDQPEAVSDSANSNASGAEAKPKESMDHRERQNFVRKIPSEVADDKSTLEFAAKRPPAVKPKTQTPPKTDLRSTLKPRGMAAGVNTGPEPEFKSMFGKLKPAQTSTYVAPDTFKDNILTGKAALSVTGGPQKTKRVDEFKESILQKKEAMKTSALEKKQSSPAKEQPKLDQPLPEALQRRKTLHKATPSITKLQDETASKEGQDQAKQQPPVTRKPKPAVATNSVPLFRPDNQPRSSESSEIGKGQTWDKQIPMSPTRMSGIQPQLEETLKKAAVTENVQNSKPETKPVPPKQTRDELNIQSSAATLGSAPSSQLSQPQQTFPIASEISPVAPKAEVGKPGSKLASRLNPNLAAMLSRGNPPRRGGEDEGTRTGSSTDNLPALDQPLARHSNKAEAEAAGGELTHMTKGRARGPKRRAPKVASQPSSNEQPKDTARTIPTTSGSDARSTADSARTESLTSATRSPIRPNTNLGATTATKPVKPATQTDSIPSSPTKSINDLKSMFGGNSTSASLPLRPAAQAAKTTVLETSSKQDLVSEPSMGLSKPLNAESSTMLSDKKEPNPADKSLPVVKNKPVVATKSPDLRRVSSSQNPKSGSKPEFEIAADDDKSKPTESPKDSSSKPVTPARLSRSPVTTTPPVSIISAMQAQTQPLTPSKSRVNTPKQPPVQIQSETSSRALPEKPTSPKPNITAQRNAGLGLQSKSTVQRTTAETKRTDVMTDKNNFSAGDLTDLLDTYFAAAATKPTSRDKAEFDTPSLLSSSDKDEPKTTTISCSIWEVTSDGRKATIPAQQQHILYEESMYLMIHTYQTSASGGNKTSEVYLWVGDAVPSAAIDDVQLFCKKDAREHNAKLEILRQGHEPASFFQALGGIIITRRSRSSALYVLCGRKHLGHIAFDEVDFALDSLCSGFPYLISAKFGSLFLWKGKGSAIDEVGCARLIGMDLGLTGEIEEVDEGQEPDSFWDAFSTPSLAVKKRTNASAFWQVRNDHAAYPCSLYRVEHERPKSAGGFWGLRSSSPPKTSTKASISLVRPYSQDDLTQGNVCVLDAYGAVYVFLDEKSCLKTAECTTALHLAQEIAMLSPSIQGRSVLPSCHVIFGQPPADVRSCFRKWTLGAADSKNQKPSACVRLEDVMQALAM